MTTLTLTHLRVECTATSPIRLGREEAGDRLRNALAAVLLRAVCPEQERGERPAPEHAALCPACWLLAAELDPGEVSRAYSLVPPLPPRAVVEAGERFSFVLTLYGQGFNFLPYFVLALPEVGRAGVGPGRGQFRLDAIRLVEPFSGRVETLLAPGERVVRVPEPPATWDLVLRAAARVGRYLEGHDLTLRFLTPVRLIYDERLTHVPDFGILFQRLLHRIDRLGQQHGADERRPVEERERLHDLANRVRLVEQRTRWVDFFGYSGRKRGRTPLSGFVGTATYRASQWGELLPWLLLGQGVQVGKVVVKGNGVFDLWLPGEGGYWDVAARQPGNVAVTA